MTRPSSFMVALGRIALAVSLLALLGAWLTQLTGGSILGLGQQHLFNDAIVLALLGIAFLVDAVIHGMEKG